MQCVQVIKISNMLNKQAGFIFSSLKVAIHSCLDLSNNKESIILNHQHKICLVLLPRDTHIEKKKSVVSGLCFVVCQPLCLYFKYMICKGIVCRWHFLNKTKFICLQSKVLLFYTNNSSQHYSFICTQLNG